MRWLVLLPILVVLILFTLSNTATVAVHFWPTDLMVTLPLAIVVLLAMAATFVVGGLLVWFQGLSDRRRARRAEHQVSLLEAQVQQLKARLTPGG